MVSMYVCGGMCVYVCMCEEAEKRTPLPTLQLTGTRVHCLIVAAIVIDGAVNSAGGCAGGAEAYVHNQDDR